VASEGRKNVLGGTKGKAWSLVPSDLEKDGDGVPATATGRWMLNVLGSIAELERGIMLERQSEGAKARAEGKYRGLGPDEVVALWRRSHRGKRGLAKYLGVVRPSNFLSATETKFAPSG
jgi:hypothetical protein